MENADDKPSVDFAGNNSCTCNLWKFNQCVVNQKFLQQVGKDEMHVKLEKNFLSDFYKVSVT